MPSRRTLHSGLTWLLAATACGSSSEVKVPGPEVHELSSVVLVDSATRDLGSMLSLTSDGHGGVILTDVLQPRVLRFGSDGGLVGQYGRPGDGPGELRIAFAAAPFEDSLLGVIDHAHRVVSLFEMGSTRWLRQLPLPELPYYTASSASGLWLGALNTATQSTVLWLAPSTDQVQSLGPMSGALLAVPTLAGAFPLVAVAPLHDTLLVGFQPLSTILTSTGGRVVDSFDVPARLRRGTPGNLAQVAGASSSLPDLASHLSLLQGLFLMADGQILALYLDPRLPDSVSTNLPRGRAAPFLSTKFATIIAADRRAACVDAVLPLSPESRLTATVIADTLVVLEQAVSDTTVVTRLRRFSFDTRHCAWQSLH